MAKDIEKVNLTVVIAGHRDQWRVWSEAMLRIADLEHRHSSHNRISQGIITVGGMTYRYLDRVDQARGQKSFHLKTIGTWVERWSRREIDELSAISQRPTHDSGMYPGLN